MKIKVCDAIMGAGKTSAAITQMLRDEDNKYIFITPYLDETNRIKQECKNRNFITPQNKGDGKLDNLHYHLGRSENIASTHTLFRHYTEDTLNLIRAEGYKLILDEVFSVVEEINIHQDDIDILLSQKIMEVSDRGVVHWLDMEYNGDFRELKQMALSNNLILHDEHLMLWTFPIEAFMAFKEVIILTYLFDCQIQKYYYDMHKVEIEYIGTKKENDTYMFCDKVSFPSHVGSIAKKIHILDNEKLNAVGDADFSLSSSWYARNSLMRGKPLIRKLKNNLINLYSNIYKSKVDVNLWTTYKPHKSLLSGKGYTTGFLSFNKRSTNEYSHKKYLAYCVNVYLRPRLKNYFLKHGVNVKEDEYALSELLQWIWRSAIRNGEEIWIYIPSMRMRMLFQNWLAAISDVAGDMNK